jgi:alpha-1,6-mannosyltransferase
MNLKSALYALAVACTLFYVFLTPYTKVEESFNMQASHDILYSLPLDAFDHVDFPGVVPRTFLGASILGRLASMPTLAFEALNVCPLQTKMCGQLAVRVSLACICVGALLFFFESILARFGAKICRWSAAFCVCQFHVLFYASRTLPNTYCLALVLVAFGCLLRDRVALSLCALTVGGVVFRSEMVLFVAPVALEALLTRRISLARCVAVGVSSAIGGVALSVLVDSHYWARWLWPEGEVFYYNTVLNQSHLWGRMPWHWYATSALPRSLLGAAALLPAGALLAARSTGTLWRPVLFFVGAYSLLPHKELRFVFYVAPLLNVVAAHGIAALERRAVPLFDRVAALDWLATPAYALFGHRRQDSPPARRRWLARALPNALGALLLLASALATVAFAMAAANNYAGGEAMRIMHERIANGGGGEQPISVHICNAAAQSGVTRFTEHRSPRWRYSKEENLSDADLLARNFTVLISEHLEPIDAQRYTVAAIVSTFSHIGAHWPYFHTRPYLSIQRAIEIE